MIKVNYINSESDVFGALKLFWTKFFVVLSYSLTVHTIYFNQNDNSPFCSDGFFPFNLISNAFHYDYNPAILTSYIDELKSKISNDGTEEEPDIFVPIVSAADESETLPPMYESGDDMDKATTYKMEAADLKSSGDYEGALEKYKSVLLF